MMVLLFPPPGGRLQVRAEPMHQPVRSETYPAGTGHVGSWLRGPLPACRSTVKPAGSVSANEGQGVGDREGPAPGRMSTRRGDREHRAAIGAGRHLVDRPAEAHRRCGCWRQQTKKGERSRVFAERAHGTASGQRPTSARLAYPWVVAVYHTGPSPRLGGRPLPRTGRLRPATPRRRRSRWRGTIADSDLALLVPTAIRRASRAFAAWPSASGANAPIPRQCRPAGR